MPRRTSTSSQKRHFQADEAHEALSFAAPRPGLRLDRVLADELGCGRRRAQALIGDGRVRVDGHWRPPAAILEAGQRIDVAAPDPAADEDRAPPATRSARVIWQSAELMVLDKPAGMHTHAGRGTVSVADYLTAAWPEQRAVGTSPTEAGLVHRLDRDTSGVVLAATTARAYADLRAQFAAQRVRKHYLALVAGALDRRLQIDQALARRRTRVVAARRRDRALRAHSVIVPLETGRSWSLVEVTITTGVTHQVRAHLALAGHPIIGDVKYGGPPAPAATRAGQLLHAQRISLDEVRSFAVAAPADFVGALWLLRRDDDNRGE